MRTSKSWLFAKFHIFGENGKIWNVCQNIHQCSQQPESEDLYFIDIDIASAKYICQDINWNFVLNISFLLLLKYFRQRYYFQDDHFKWAWRNQWLKFSAPPGLFCKKYLKMPQLQEDGKFKISGEIMKWIHLTGSTRNGRL